MILFILKGLVEAAELYALIAALVFGFKALFDYGDRFFN